jgi:hypothetical protein
VIVPARARIGQRMAALLRFGLYQLLQVVVGQLQKLLRGFEVRDLSGKTAAVFDFRQEIGVSIS